MTSSRFHTTVQLLALLAQSQDSGPTSVWLGHFLRQSPSALRRLFVSLERAGLITCRPGPDGGPLGERTLGTAHRP